MKYFGSTIASSTKVCDIELHSRALERAATKNVGNSVVRGTDSAGKNGNVVKQHFSQVGLTHISGACSCEIPYSRMCLNAVVTEDAGEAWYLILPECVYYRRFLLWKQVGLAHSDCSAYATANRNIVTVSECLLPFENKTAGCL